MGSPALLDSYLATQLTTYFLCYFFFFAFTRPKTKEGTVLSDERWAENITKSCRNAFFRTFNPVNVNYHIPQQHQFIHAGGRSHSYCRLLGFVVFFIYYDLRGD